MSGKKVLVVDDEVHIQELIKYNLEVSGYKVDTAISGEEALEKMEQDKPDIVILDWMLPGIDGLEVCKRAKMNAKTKDIPIIMLTAKNDEFDKVLGLELGADDYLTKPFSVRELIARVKVILRRAAPAESEVSPIIKFGDISIDQSRREVYSKGTLIDLPLKEFEILKLLAQNIGRVVTRETLLEKVWGCENYGETRTIDVHIRHIRQKIESDDGAAQYIETVRGVGYKLIVKGE